MKEVLDYLAKHALRPMPDSLIKYLTITNLSRTLRKKDLLLSDNLTDFNLCFVTKGTLRSVYLFNGIEYTFNFFQKNDAILAELFMDKPGFYNFEALEDTEVVCFRDNDIEDMQLLSHDFNFILRKVFEKDLVSHVIEYDAFKRLDPSERFHSFLTKNPDLFLKVPHEYLASYLDIPVKTFHRLKNSYGKRPSSGY